MPQTKGAAFLFGCSGTVTQGKVQNFSVTKSAQNLTSVKNEAGNEVSRRYDDVMEEGTCTIVLSAAFTEAIAGDFEYNGITYEIVSTTNEESNTEHRKANISFKKSEYITSP